MKTIEEKAKAYDEALERARAINNGKDVDVESGTTTCEYIFPELKEDDTERIRKNCIHFLELQKQHHAAIFEIEECIDWLETQGEQKPTLPKWKYKKDNTPLLRDSIILNKYGGVAKSPSGAIVSDVWVLDYDELAKLPKEKKIEPKFKVGDWVIFITSGSIYQVEKIENYEYTLRHILGGSLCLSFSNEKLIREWTIQDAKDGDVLEFGDHGRFVTGILSFVNKTTGKVDVSCLLEDNKFKVGVFYNLDTVKPHPAAKEQCDALMKAMNDAGYEWDAEKKELKKKRKS